jgi:hypothetical protein
MLTAIVGILLGNLLVATLFAPALKELREILVKFDDISLPFRPLFALQQIPQADRQKAQDKATLEFNRLFRQYAMSFNAFRKVGLVFLGSIVVLAVPVAWQLSWGWQRSALLLLGFAALVFFVGQFLRKAIAPTPAELVSIDFMQNNFASLHLSSLFNSARVRIDPGRALHETFMRFNVSQNIMFLGYRFLSAVSNRDCSQIYFVVYGRIDCNTKFVHEWRPEPELQFFSTPLGAFSLTDAMRASPLLNLHTWLFVPSPLGWVTPEKLHPRFLSQEITDDSITGQAAIVITPTNFSWESVDENVEFERKLRLSFFESWNITQLKVPAADSPQRILQMYRKKVERCRGIQSRDYPSGVTIKL